MQFCVHPLQGRKVQVLVDAAIVLSIGSAGRRLDDERRPQPQHSMLGRGVLARATHAMAENPLNDFP